MRKKPVSGLILMLLLTSMLSSAFTFQPVKAEGGTIYIRADGSVDPPTAPILNVGNGYYTFTANIYDSIVVERNNIEVDGAGYTVRGTGGGTGISLSERSYVTIKNMKIEVFEYGIHLHDSSYNTIFGNNITNNYYDILLDASSNNNSISGNNITNSHKFTIWLDQSSHNSVSGNNITNNGPAIYLIHHSSYNSIFENNITNNHFGTTISGDSNNKFYHNNFIDNTEQVHSYDSTNAWDDGYPRGGNYWSDYEARYPDAEELHGSGIWDTPYIIDENNRDNYPLMKPWTPTPPTPVTQWNRTYGGAGVEEAHSVQQASDGGYVIAGRTTSYGAGGGDLWLVRVDSTGDMVWNKTYGGVGWDWAYSVQQTRDGGYIIAGLVESLGTSGDDFSLVKADARGNMLWNRTYGGARGEGAFSVQQTTGGGYIAAGYTFSFGAGERDVWLVKTDAAGNLQWNRTYGGANVDLANSVQQTRDGGYIIAGSTFSYGAGSGDLWLIKTDLTGNIVWNKTYGGTRDDRGRAVEQTSDGGYIVAGSTFSYGAGWTDFWLLKTDSVGNVQWNKTFGGTADEMAFSVDQTRDGGYVAAGWTTSYGAGTIDVWLVKTDARGNMLWNRTYGGARWDEAYSVQETSDEGYIIAGWTESFGAGVRDVWLIKLAPWTPGPPEVPDNFADLGNLTDEASHNLIGWGAAQGPPENPHVSPSGDRTKRYQLLRGDSSVDLMVDEVGVPYFLTAEVEDGYCTDNFEIYVNGEGPIYEYIGKNVGTGPVTVVNHQVLVPAEYITARRITITFRNTATDECGLAAVYNVRLTPTPPVIRYVITTEHLKVRSYPGKPDDNNVITMLPKGSVSQIVEHPDNGKFVDGYHWWHVKFGVVKGWAAEEYLEEYDFPEPPKAKAVEGALLTAYYVPFESELMGNGTVTNPHGITGTFYREFLYSAKGVCMQGSGRAIDRQTIKWVSGGWMEKNGYRYYWVNRDLKPTRRLYDDIWSNGRPYWIANETSVIFEGLPENIYKGSFWDVYPWYSVAVDEDVIPIGSIVYIAELDGWTLRNGERLNGYFLATDTGGAIIGNRIDIFVGAGNIALQDWWDIQNQFKDKIDPVSGKLKLNVTFDDSTRWTLKHTKLKSPGELRVYDSQNRVTGVVNGEIKNEIANSGYNSIDNTVAIVFPTDSYRYEVAGTEEGLYGLAVTSITELETITVTATDIPTSSNVIHQYSVDWAAICLGEEGVTIEVDSNGDGIFEHTFTSDGQLNHSEYVAALDAINTWITDSDFNGTESFRAVFTPDGNTELFKLTATNPGQFYFNILVNNTWSEPLNMTIAYSIDPNFTLKGARRTHVYADLNRTIDITANCTFTDNTITVYNLAPNATAYVTIHLDYALKGTTWTAEEVEAWYSEHDFNATVSSVTSKVVITDP